MKVRISSFYLPFSVLLVGTWLSSPGSCVFVQLRLAIPTLLGLDAHMDSCTISLSPLHLSDVDDLFLPV